MKITYIGTYATGTLHQMFDTCFLHVCSLLAEHVDCYKHKSTLDYIRKKGATEHFIDNVSLHPIYVLRSRNIYITLLGELIAACTNVYMYLKYSKSSTVVVNFNNLFAVHALNFVSGIKKRPLWIVCHGEMELLINNGGGMLARLRRKLIQNYFFKKKMSDYIHFIVLGESIFQNLSNILNKEQILHFNSIDHPYYLYSGNHCVKTSSTRVKHLGVVGSLSPAKGLHEFMAFVESVEKEKLDCKISIIGRISTHKYDDFMAKHNIDITWVYLERDEMEKRIKELDCVLYFYPKDSYKLIASGAVFDAIKYNIPVLAFKNDYFEYIFKKLNYPAFLVDSVLNMIEVLKANRLINVDEKNIRKDIFSPLTIANAIDFFRE